MEEEENSGFKVKDRRRFDESGKRKDGNDDGQEETLQGNKTPQDDTSPPEDGTGFVTSESGLPMTQSTESSDSNIDYSSFILSLATQAMVQLGEMPAPPGVEIPKNVEAAKNTIDVIEMLNLKTQGNLSDPEQQLTEEILHNLRIGYVRSKQ